MSNIFLLLFAILYLFLGLLACIDKKYNEFWKKLQLFITVYVGYNIIMLLGHAYVDNPKIDFFISLDQTKFYSYAVDLSHYSIKDLLHNAFSEYAYRDAPLAYAYFGILAKCAQTFNIHDILLFIKLNTVFIGSLIPLLIYKTVQPYFTVTTKHVIQNLLIFSFTSPLLLFSCQMMRDIHICFLYTLGAYITLVPRIKGRWGFLILIATIVFYFRSENGFFFLLFIGFALYRKYGQSTSSKIILFIVVILVLFSIGNIVIETMNDTLTRYGERNLNEASSSSLGAQLSSLPFPLNYISKTIFAMLLPFPFWKDVASTYDYSYLYILEMAFPFYWSTIIYYLLSIWYKDKDNWEQSLRWLFVICITYILLSSASEFTVRRIMAVYPIIMGIYLIMRNRTNKRISHYATTSFCSLIFLHLIYLLIK